MLKIRKPVSVWNQPLRFELKKFIFGLAKAAVSGWKLEAEEAAGNLLDAVSDASLRNDPGQVAWVLIFQALLQSLREVLEDGKDLFRAEIEESQLAAISATLEDAMAVLEVEIDAGFFERPQDLPLLQNLGPALRAWLQGLGLSAVEAAALHSRLPDRFVSALHRQWLQRPDEYKGIFEAVDTPFTRADKERRGWLQYNAWLREQANARLFGEAFSLKQVYVELCAYYEEKPRDKEGREADIRQEARRHVVDLHQTLLDWAQDFKPGDAIRLISGGPGSGKSTFGKMFAAHLAAHSGLKVLFIPLHLLDAQADLVKAVADFVALNPYLSGSPLDVKEGEKRLLIIFDGLDELAMQGKAAAETAERFVSEVVQKLNHFNINAGLQRQVLISGRELAIQANATQFRLPGQILHVLPYYLSAEERKAYRDPGELLATDRRDLWWQKYGAASGKDYAALPEALRGDNLTDITRQPLLNYLVALSYERGQVDFSHADTTLNRIYQDLLDAVYERQYEQKRVHASIHGLSKENFYRVLEEIALAVWHGDGRCATVNAIHERCKSSKLDRYLTQFEDSAEAGVTRLLTAFYFRQSGERKGERTFEFTHKSFGEYLTARRLARMLERVHDEYQRQETDPDSGWNERDALKYWAEFCGPTAIDEYLYPFVRDEIALRPADKWPVWQATLCRLIESALRQGMPMEKLGLSSFLTMDEQSRNAEEALLVVLYSCACLTKQVSKIIWPSDTAFGKWIKRLQWQQYQLYLGGLVSHCLGYLDLSNCIISFHEFFGANFRKSILTNANLICSHLNCTNFEDANLTRARLEFSHIGYVVIQFGGFKRTMDYQFNCHSSNLVRANLTEADLRTARLWGVELIEANLENADLANTDFLNSDLAGANLTGANVDSANFEGVNLDGTDLSLAVNLDQARNLNKAKNLNTAKLPEDFILP